MQAKTKCTVVFLLKGEEICLARKKKSIHHADGTLGISLDKWNGYGGKQEEGETITETAIRELFDESGIKITEKDLEYTGVISFFWPGNTSKDLADMEVYFYFVENYEGTPKEGDEMGPPEFFKMNAIPYDEMMAGDKIFLPKFINSEIVEGAFFFDKNEFVDMSKELNPPPENQSFPMR